MDSQTLEKIKEKKVEILEFLNNKSDIEVVFKSNQAERYEPFPLTNIQNSYVIGRNSAYELGDVTCHGYIEITYQEELDKEKLEMAWNKVIAKHDMLRAIIYENGYQRVQKDVPEVKIESYDLRTCSEDEQLLNLQNIRANYAEKQYPLGQWPMCDIVLSLWKGKSIIHFSLDMLITDFMSANLILNDLDNYYHGKAVEVKVETLYRDIVLYNQRKSMSKSKERKKAERYWQDKIRNMGTAPELIINNQKTGERETFKQLKFFIDEEGKENINEIAKELRVTASTVILTAFGEVINKWSKNSKFRGRISKWISASAEENKKVDVAELPQNDLEEQIARIWCKELNIERIGRNDNFYLSGGDSLLIAQVIARMRETIEAAKRWSWDDLLKEMMKTPTIRGVAKILSNQAGENEQDKSLVIIKEAAESSEKKVTVVFHAGTGTLTPYNSLIAYITERSQENEAVMGFTFGDEAEYLAIPTDKIFENLGKKYGRILSELGFTEYTLIGHCVGGLIALETAHYLKDKGKNVSSVTLLSTSIPHKKEETVLADLDMKIFETAVQTSLYNELLLERTFASLIDADIKKAGHQVDNDTLQQVIEYLIFNNGGNITVQALCSLTGKFAEVGAEFQRLHSMSATERMNDLYTTIERPNGQLMEHQRKMLNVLFRVFAQNFRCVSSYIPKVYTGKMRVFDCESAIANFFPSLFSEDKKTWEQYAQGEFLFDTMKGDHISCMNSPYIEENVKKILDL